MSEKRTSMPSRLDDRPSRGRADLSRIRRVSDTEIRRSSPPELAGLPKDFWAGARLVPPVAKQPVSIRLDADVLEWFRRQGPRYQSRINAALLAFMHATGTARAGRAKK